MKVLICDTRADGSKRSGMIGYDGRAAKDAFDRRHGERVQWNFVFYFADGACRTLDAISEMREPPADPFERAQMILTFHKAKLARSVRDFQNLKEQLAHQACGNGEDISHLKELQKNVGRQTEAVRQAQEAVDSTDIGRMRKGARESHQERLAEQAEWRGQLRMIKI